MKAVEMKTPMRSIKLLTPCLSLAMALICSAAVAQEGGAEDTSAKLEIRQYRFSHHANGKYDRLVLEFDRRDENTTAPKISTTAEKGETLITVDGAVLTGAIPESLINDIYAKRSHFLGPIAVGMDAPSTGFSLRAAHKGNAKAVTAQWLTNPSRLVIDAKGGGAVHVASAHVAPAHVEHPAPAARETLSIGRSAKYPALNDLSCFPATAKVGLTVIFRPQVAQAEELQNIRINTDGTNPVDAAPPSDAIVCYPKASQIQAALSFENHTGYFVTTGQPETVSTPPAPVAPVAPAAPALTKMALPPLTKAATASAPKPVELEGHEDDLDPGPLTLPTLPTLPGGRTPAEAMPTLPRLH